jgi:glycine/D-amino acid oxidase-like deaminating enzyme
MTDRIDVLVVGGGLAGCAAALAAAREGVTVRLVERAGYLGGNATRAMVGPWQSFHAAVFPKDGSLPRQVIGGIAQEFVDELTAHGACLGHIVDPIGFAGSLTPVDSEALKLYLPAKLVEAGVRLELGHAVTAADLATAKQVVDASGCACAARMLGAPLIEPSAPQPHSWLFTMRDVDTAAVREYQLTYPGEFVLHPAHTRLRADFIAVSGYFSLVAAARASGGFTIPRDRLLFFSTPTPGEVLVNTTRIAADHPQPELEGLRQVRELADWLPRQVPGFAHARLGRVADGLGRRESTRLQGQATLTAADIVASRDFPDAVAHGCYPIDIHSADSAALITRKQQGRGFYGIPLGCLLPPPGTPNLICAGRCISADREGFASARVLPAAMATGQAAGLIAAWRTMDKEIKPFTCLSRISLV